MTKYCTLRHSRGIAPWQADRESDPVPIFMGMTLLSSVPALNSIQGHVFIIRGAVKRNMRLIRTNYVPS